MYHGRFDCSGLVGMLPHPICSRASGPAVTEYIVMWYQFMATVALISMDGMTDLDGNFRNLCGSGAKVRFAACCLLPRW